MYVSRDDLIDVFEDTEKLYQTDETLRKSIADSIAGTKIYMEGEMPILPQKKFTDNTNVTVNKYRTFETAQFFKRKYPELKVAVLNFASATNPGGGVTHGSRAQEEALCRCSTLYPTLKTKTLWKKYYEFHRNRQDVLYTDACIYTPDILVIKSDESIPQRMPTDKWIKVDVLTCAAPNLREIPNKMNPVSDKTVRVSDNELFEIHIQRAKQIISVAAHHDVDILILGAFGCGAFSNKPSVVANAYSEVIPRFNGYFKEICFAVYCPPKSGDENFKAFDKVFKK